MGIEGDLSDIGLSAEEQAQFDSMRETMSPGSNADNPEQLVTDDAAPPVLEVDQVTPAPDTPAVDPHDDDDVEVVKDDQGREVRDPKTGKPQKRVSFHKYQRTANRVAELERQLATTSEERARIDERLNIINEALLAKPAAPEAPAAEEVDSDPMPDPEQNIFEYAKWQQRELDRRTQQFTQVIDELRGKQDDRDLGDAYRQDASRFANQEPSFGQAYGHLINARMNELRANGWTDEAQIAAQVEKEERGLVRNALQARQSPSARIFAMAKARGFTPQAAPAPTPAPAKPAAARPAAAVPGTGLGEAPPAAARPAPSAAPRMPSVSEQVELAQRGADAAMSLSNAGGGAVTELTAQKLLTMGEDEFNMVVSQMSNAKLRELFGD